MLGLLFIHGKREKEETHLLFSSAGNVRDDLGRCRVGVVDLGRLGGVAGVRRRERLLAGDGRRQRRILNRAKRKGA